MYETEKQNMSLISNKEIYISYTYQYFSLFLF